MPRFSELTEIDVATLAENDRLAVLNVGTAIDYVVTPAVLRQKLLTAATDHSGSVGDPSHRFSAAHLDQLLLYGGGSVVASTPLIDATQTWNNAAVQFFGWRLNITDTASAATSLLADLQVAGSSKFKVTKAGNVVAAGSVTATSLIGPLTGNADTATSATSASAVPAAGLTGGTLAAGVTASSLTSLGRIAALLATQAQSQTATVSAANGAATNIGAALTVTGAYLIVASYPGSGQTAIVVTYDSGTTASSISAALIAGTVTVTVVGAQLKVTQSSGVTKNVTLSYLLLNL